MLSDLLKELCREKELHRMFRWLITTTAGCTISNDGLRLRCEHPHAWSSCMPLLPTGIQTWSIQVVEASAEKGAMVIGVSEGNHGWGLNPWSGEVSLLTTDTDPEQSSS